MQRMKGYFSFLVAVFFLLFFVPSSFSATVDVMIVYDTTAKSWVDSHTGMSTFAAFAVAKMNQAAANSGVNLTFNMVYTAQISSYTYPSYKDTQPGDNLDNALSTLMDSNTINTWRNTCGADVVVMLVDTGYNYGTVGLGYELSQSMLSHGTGANYAFSVSAIQSVYDSETMTHEVGHNFGCGHSKVQSDSPGPGIYSYSAGWYFSDYSSIMAYNDIDGDGVADYIEAPYFSNPDITVDEVATGDSTDGDNARTLRETMDVVAAYRTATSTTTTTTTSTTTSISSSTTTIKITTTTTTSTSRSSTTNTSTTMADSSPNQFTFTDLTGVALNTEVTSNAITVSDIDTAVPISITGGSYSINGADYTNETGTVNNGDTVTVRQTSSEDYSTTTDATLNIGGVTDTFSVTTKAESKDSGGGCFIATAAFGSPLAGQVEILRQFRDRYLLTNAWGKKFVSWYYRNGPVAASYIKDKSLAKAAVRVALYPLIGFSILLISGYLKLVMIGLLLSMLFYLRFRPKQSITT